MTNLACCAHLKVIWTTRNIGDGRTQGWWQCDLCESKFAPVAALKSQVQQLREALNRIACGHACGCVPCTGQCESQEALKIILQEIRDVATSALAATEPK
jgi:hypothetical protein